MSTDDITPERQRENLEVALTTLVVVCKRWTSAPLVVLRAIDVAQHVLQTGKPPATSVSAVHNGQRYMEPFNKVRELASWTQAKRERETSPPSGFVGGHGYPDPEIYDWVDKLNALSRVCTLQSCAGHKCTPTLMCSSCMRNEFDAAWPTHTWNGQLWLWLDKPLSHWFHHNALTLAASPLIEKLTVLYHVEGREIVDIVFRGAGTDELDASMKQILSFFEDGNRLCNLG